jgi:hypothetical protein
MSREPGEGFSSDLIILKAQHNCKKKILDKKTHPVYNGLIELGLRSERDRTIRRELPLFFTYF